MKKIYFIVSVMAAITTLSSCTKGAEENSDPESDGMTLRGSISETTRTYLDGLDVKWLAGDELSVFSDTDFDHHSFALTTGADSNLATFSTEGSPIEGGTFVAYYPADKIQWVGSMADGQKVGLWYPRIDIPAVQSYVPNGVADDLLFMSARGTDLQNMQFEQMLGIIRIKLYDTSIEPVTISKIVLTNNGDKPIAGSYYDDYINYTTQTGLKRTGFTNLSSSAAAIRSVTIENINTQLSNDPENPTVFNFVVTPGTISGFELSIVDSKDGVMTKNKAGAVTVQAGRIETFPAFEFFASLQPNKGLTYSIDGGEPVEYEDGDFPVPTSSFTLSMDSDGLLTESVLSKVAETLLLVKNGSSIDVDLSGCQYMDQVFPALFRKNPAMKSFSLPSNIKTIADYAFETTRLTSVTLPADLERIGNYAFQTSWIETLHIPAKVKTIGWFQMRHKAHNKAYDVDVNNPYFSSLDGVLYNKAKTTLIDYPKNKGDKTFVVPGTVTTIADYALMETSIETLTIPASVTKISPSALNSILMLSTIICEGTTPPTLAINLKNVGQNVIGEKVINVPTGCKDFYEANSGWKEFIDTFGYVVVDGSLPSSSSATITNLGKDDRYAGDQSFWK